MSNKEITWRDFIKGMVAGIGTLIGTVKNISGPPPQLLDEFITKIKNGNLFVQLPAFKWSA